MEYEVKPSYQGVSMLEAVKLFFKNYANFSGRSSRSEYWWVYLVEMIVFLPLDLLANVLQILLKFNHSDELIVLAIIVSVLMINLGFGLMIPGLALGCRRLHDIGKSGWWILLGLIPFVGSVILIIWMIEGSVPGENQYGCTVAKEQPEMPQQ